MALGANATITVCGVEPDENGHFNCSFIKSGSIIWDEDSRTLTLDNAVVEDSSDGHSYIYPISITEDATIVIHGDCQLITSNFVALALDGSNSKRITIQGDGSLYLSSSMRGIYLKCTQLTIKDITLNAAKHIANNGDGVLVALTFDNVSADITGGVERIGEGITLKDCSITEPEGAYIEHSDTGYFIATPDGDHAYHVVISRDGNKLGDVNGDSEVTIADGVAVLNAMASEEKPESADVNGDGDITIADFVAVLNLMAEQ